MGTSALNNVVIVEDHPLFRKGLCDVINSFSGFKVLWEASDGLDFIQKISKSNLPDIVVLDIAMNKMDGIETAKWITEKYPDIKMLILSQLINEDTILRMIKAGVDGYLHKESTPEDLLIALTAISNDDTYYSPKIASIIINSLTKEKNTLPDIKLSEMEIDVLKLICQEMPYKSISIILKPKYPTITLRKVESIRVDLFERLKIVSKVGLALYAVKKGYYKIDN